MALTLTQQLNPSSMCSFAISPELNQFMDGNLNIQKELIKKSTQNKYFFGK